MIMIYILASFTLFFVLLFAQVHNFHASHNNIDFFTGDCRTKVVGNMYPAYCRGCLAITVRGQETPSGFYVSLVSKVAIIPAYKTDCFAIPSGFTCHFLFVANEMGAYNLSVRGDNYIVTSVAQSKDPLAALGFVHGNYREVDLVQLYTLNVISDLDHSNVTCLKEFLVHRNTMTHEGHPCTFHHEKRISNHPLEINPRWRERSWSLDALDDYQRSTIWYNDTFIWGNDICVYKSVTLEDFLQVMNLKKIYDILLIGDSLTRFMYGDFADLFSGCTAEWLRTHPQKYLGNTTEANNASWLSSSWDLRLSGWGDFSDLVSVCKHLDVGPPPKAPDCCRSSNCSRTDVLRVRLKQFLPGHTASNEPQYNMPPVPRSAEEWKAVFFTRYLLNNTDVPDLIIFNAGLWLINNYPDSHLTELKKILESLLSLCKENSILFVWRSTFYHHRATLNDKIMQANDLARQIIGTYDNAFYNAFYIHSVHAMSAVRPDRTVDGFHYSCRKVRNAWHFCTLANDGKLDKDCVRQPDWPMSVSKGATLMLLNYLINSKELHKA